MLREVQIKNGVVRASRADPRITSFKGIPLLPLPSVRIAGGHRSRAGLERGVGGVSVWAHCHAGHTGINQDNIYDFEWHVDPKIPMAEDCLYLNVWTPATSADQKLPVFVWYFGGGLQVGYPSEMEFDGERIARRGIVVSQLTIV